MKKGFLDKKRIASGATKRWNSKSKDGRKLVKLLQSNAITPTMTTTQIKELFPEFKKYPATSLRGALRRAKTTTGYNVREDENGEIQFFL